MIVAGIKFTDNREFNNFIRFISQDYWINFDKVKSVCELSSNEKEFYKRLDVILIKRGILV